MENIDNRHLVVLVEGLRLATDKLNSKNFYAFNPSFDKCKPAK